MQSRSLWCDREVVVPASGGPLLTVRLSRATACKNRMPRVLVLAATTGYQTRSFGEAAERLGVELVFATDRCHLIEDPWQDQAIPIRFHDEDASVAAIVDAAQVRPDRRRPRGRRSADGDRRARGAGARACRAPARGGRGRAPQAARRASGCATPGCRFPGFFPLPIAALSAPSAIGDDRRHDPCRIPASSSRSRCRAAAA